MISLVRILSRCILALLPCLALGQGDDSNAWAWPHPPKSDGYYWYLKAVLLLPSQRSVYNDTGSPRVYISPDPNPPDELIRQALSNALPLIEKGNRLPTTDGRRQSDLRTLHVEPLWLKIFSRQVVRVAGEDLASGDNADGYRWLKVGLQFANHQFVGPGMFEMSMKSMYRLTFESAIAQNAKFLTSSQIQTLSHDLLGTIDSRQILAGITRNAFEPVIATLKIKPFDAERIIGPIGDNHAKLINEFINKDPASVHLLVDGIHRESLKNAQIFYMPEGQWASAIFNFNPVIDDMEKWKKLGKVDLGVFTFLGVMDELEEKGGYWGRGFVEPRERTRMARISLALI